MEAKPLTGKGLHNEVMKLFLESKFKKNVIILDAGCGEGALLKRLSCAGYKNLNGCDINDKNVKFKKMKLKKSDLNIKLPYKNESFDVVFSVENIEHLENPWGFIKEIHRVLKPKGTFILSTPNLHNWYQRLNYLFTGTFNGFETDPEQKYHIYPAFFWSLKKMTYKKFKINDVSYGRSIIPILQIKIPLKNSLVSECYIVKMKKI